MLIQPSIVEEEHKASPLVLEHLPIFRQHLQGFPNQIKRRPFSSQDVLLWPATLSKKIHPAWLEALLGQALFCLWDFSLQHQPGRLRKFFNVSRTQITSHTLLQLLTRRCLWMQQELCLGKIKLKNETKQKKTAPKGHLCSGSVTMEMVKVVCCALIIIIQCRTEIKREGGREEIKCRGKV